MGLFDKLRNELIDIIEWLDDDKHTLVWRFPRYQNEIKNGAQLIVRPGQVAIFVLGGQMADLFEPGHHTLKTENLPILSTIAGWKYGFNSPFKAECYFVNTTQITDLKWGTTNPVMLRDPEFGPIRLRAFGIYSLKAVDPRALLKELVGTDSRFEADEVSELLRSLIITSLSELLGKQQIAALDLAANYRTMSETLRKEVQERIDDEYGLSIPQLNIVNVSFPEEVEKALDVRTSMGVVGDLNKFQQFQTGQAIREAASNPGGGGAAEGLGMGLGFGMANQMLRNQAGAGVGAGGGGSPVLAPPPLPGAQPWHFALNGAAQGPFPPAQLQQAIAAGQVTRETLVWTAGMAEWQPAGQVPALAGAFVAPPPMPAAR
jgi:membrane protease subunit (stomatin/prohibitin family)